LRLHLFWAIFSVP